VYLNLNSISLSSYQILGSLFFDFFFFFISRVKSESKIKMSTWMLSFSGIFLFWLVFNRILSQFSFYLFSCLVSLFLFYFFFALQMWPLHLKHYIKEFCKVCFCNLSSVFSSRQAYTNSSFSN
jgi:hypothetical protein